METKVLIVDDHRLFREGLKNLLQKSDDINVVGEAENGMQAIEKSKALKPDVILMDIVMPEMNGIHSAQHILRENPHAKVIGLTMHNEKYFIKEMLKSGVYGYLFKDCSYTQLIDAIESVQKGKKYLSSETTNVVVSDYVNGLSSNSNDKNHLSEREEEVFKLLVNGYTISEISNMLFVSVKTIGTHKKNIMKKLGLKNMTELIKYALKNELITLT
ncbi:MAG: response regulator transcription factor [Bacteroidota bacterium]|nr:response regulator transcription factor [Bacteroidota bacterium]